MPDYRTIPPTIEGPCLYTVTGKCCIFNWIDGKLVQACPPDWCAPLRYGWAKAPPSWWTKLWGMKGQ